MRVQRHELNEADNYSLFAREHAKGNNLVFIKAAQQHTIDLHRIEAGAARCPDSCQNAFISVGNAGDAGEAFGIDRVHADGDAIETGVFQRLRDLGQQMAVGSQRNFRLLSLGGAQLSEVANKLHDALAQQRLAAGQANLGDAEANQDARHAQIIGEGQVGVERALVTGAAVDALVVAAVGDGDPQVGDGAAEFVGEEHESWSFVVRRQEPANYCEPRRSPHCC